VRDSVVNTNRHENLKSGMGSIGGNKLAKLKIGDPLNVDIISSNERERTRMSELSLCYFVNAVEASCSLISIFSSVRVRHYFSSESIKNILFVRQG
jgi:hypothetical protein